jgi:pSer/pThr/pTyr-binding forkhead associated (FHA) protein
MAVLTVTERNGDVKARLNLRGRRAVTIGRSPRNFLTLTSSSISRRHALLFEHDGGWHLVDLGSRGGIYSGASRVHWMRLEPGTWARMGPAYLWLLAEGGSTLGAGAPEPASDRPSNDAVIAILEPGAGSLRRQALSGELVTMGRSPRCDVILADAAASRLHCVLYREQHAWMVANASPNPRGTRFAGRPTWRRRLTPERPIRAGDTAFWLERAPAGEEATEAEALASYGFTASAFLDEPEDLLASPVPHTGA